MFESRQSGSTLEPSARRQELPITLNGKQVSATSCQNRMPTLKPMRFAAYGTVVGAQLLAQFVPVRKSGIPSALPPAPAPGVAAGE